MLTDLPFPRIAAYCGVRSSGYPFCETYGRPLRPDVISKFARFQVAALPLTPLGDDRQDIADALIQANPRQILVAYIMPCTIWPVVDDSGTTYYQRFHRMVRENNAWIRDGEAPDQVVDHLVNVDLTRMPSEDYVELVASMTRRFDGVFLDAFEVLPPSNGMAPEDCRSRDQWLSAWASERIRLLGALLEALPRRALIFVNGCANDPTVTGFVSGTMRERFPNLWGGTWESNVEGAIAEQNELSATDRLMWFFTALERSPTWWKWEHRRVRFGLAASCMMDGCHVFAPSDPNPSVPWWEWWFDEYSVNTLGESYEPPIGETGWLGRALGPARMIHTWSPGDAPAIGPWWLLTADCMGLTRDAHAACWSREFEHGLVLANPSPQTIHMDLAAGFSFLKGKVAPGTNTGLPATSVSLEPGDSRFLWKTKVG